MNSLLSVYFLKAVFACVVSSKLYLTIFRALCLSVLSVLLSGSGSHWRHIWWDLCMASCRLLGSSCSPHVRRYSCTHRLAVNLPLYRSVHTVLCLQYPPDWEGPDWFLCWLEPVLCVSESLSLSVHHVVLFVHT